MRRADVDLASLRTSGGVMLAAGLAWPMVPVGAGIGCPFHAITGVPCPLCGMTRSVVATLHLQLHRALTMNPAGILAVVVAIVLLVAWPRLPRAVTVPGWAGPAGVGLLWSCQLLRPLFR